MEFHKARQRLVVRALLRRFGSAPEHKIITTV